MNLQEYSRCTHDQSVRSISFDEEGVCNPCRLRNLLVAEFFTSDTGSRRLQEMEDRIRHDSHHHSNNGVMRAGAPDVGKPADISPSSMLSRAAKKCRSCINSRATRSARKGSLCSDDCST